MLKKTLLVSSLLLSSAVMAQTEDAYMGISYAQTNVKVSGISEEAKPGAVYIRLGGEFNENFSGELRAGIGLDDDILGVDVEVKSLYGAYLRGGIPIKDIAFLYAIAGFSHAELKVSALGVSASDSDSDFSFGFGVDFKFSEKGSVNIEYMNYYDDADLEVDAISAGVSYTF